MKNKLFIKKIISAALCLVCFACAVILPSCSATQKEKMALTLNGVEISNDVFTYFLDLAVSRAGNTASEETIKENAIALTTTYFKTNSLASAHGITLTIAEKAAVSEKVNDYWLTYDGYYEKIGVTKETLTKVFTADMYRDRLILSYYGEGGTEAIPISRLYAAFRSNYVVFQAVTGYLTQTDSDGNTVRLPQNEIEDLITRFQGMADVVNSGESTMEEAADYLSQAGIQSNLQTVVLHKDDDSYPAGFFEQLQKTETRYAAIIGSQDYIFLVLRGEPDSNSTYFNDKKIDIIKSIVGDAIDGIIEGAYEVEPVISNKDFDSVLRIIKNAGGTGE